MDPMMAQGQLALSMMTPEQRKAAVETALSKATPEEKKQLEKQQKEMQQKFAKATPEERASMQQQAMIMQDIGVFCRHLRPEGGDPDKPLGTVDVLAAMAECGSFGNLTAAIKNAAPEQQKLTIKAFMDLEQALLENGTEADAAALRERKSKPEVRRPLLLMLYILYKHKLGDKIVLDETVTFYYEATKRLATQLLMHAQMTLPQQRWVQQTVGVSRVAALLVNELWSHDDPECVRRMGDILDPPDKPEELGMPFPELAIKARTVLAMELETGLAGKLEDSHEPAKVLPGQLVAVQVELTRKHAGKGGVPSEIANDESNPKGILEAYWLYIEGHTPVGANTLLAAQPLTVTDLKTTTLPGLAKFEAPKETGEFKITVHLASTSVVGCDQKVELSFIVQEDDVPALE